ncbi:MAG TPA: OST-HTH/LOTUS domain-containing protein [Thiobacillus sp.]|nr:OST-HTH/LOTUS domain-containing protein [Thiobacillus sp.]HQT70420.1 OST-HTH/LOTUS domain-containing protein [Thiobacillus sp.]
MSLLRKSIEAAADEAGWAGMGAVGQPISKQASFDSRNYGYTKLSGLFQAIGLFELRTHGKGLQVRDKRTPQP